MPPREDRHVSCFDSKSQSIRMTFAQSYFRPLGSLAVARGSTYRSEMYCLASQASTTTLETLGHREEAPWTCVRLAIEAVQLSTTSRKSPNRGFFSRFMGYGSSAKSKRSSGPSRKSWISEVVPEGEEAPLNPGHERNMSEGMSISVPLTPSTVDGERKLGPARWDSRERLRFPLPPSGSAGSGERESLISSNPTE
jgi:hypothetical protein